MISPIHPAQEILSQLKPGQMLEPLFDIIPNVHYFVKDRESRFITASLSFAQLLGAQTVDEIIGKTDFDYSADFMAKAFFEDDQKVLSGGKPLLNLIELVPTHDSIDWLSTSKIPLYDPDNEIIGLAGITRILSDSDELYRDHPEMRQIIRYIQTEFREKITTRDMAREAGISVSSVERLFRNTFGVTPAMYLRKTRLNAACRRLRDTDQSLACIAVSTGLSDQTHMTRAFRQDIKITPFKYRKRFSNPSKGSSSDLTLLQGKK